MSLPNLQLTADAQNVHVFAQGVSIASLNLLKSEDKTSQTHKEYEDYLVEYLNKLRDACSRLETALA